MWYIKSIEARDILSWKNLILKFDNNTIYSIIGRNGSGKSSILEIIKWVLFKKTNKKNIERYTTDNGWAKMTLCDGKNEVEIKREVLTPAAVSLNGTAVTQEHLEQLLRCSYVEFMSAVMCDQKRISSFVNEKTPAGKSKIFGEMIGASILDDMRIKIQKVRNSYESDFERAEATVVAIKTEIDEMKLSFMGLSVKEYFELIKKKNDQYLKYRALSTQYQESYNLAVRQHQSWNTYEEGIAVYKGIKDKIQELSSKIKPLLALFKSKGVDNLPLKIKGLREAEKGLREEATKLSSEMEGLRKKKDEYEKLLAQGGKCPTCGTVLLKDAQLKNIEKIVQDSSKQFNEKNSTKNSVRNSLSDTENKIRALEKEESSERLSRNTLQLYQNSLKEKMDTVKMMKMVKPEFPRPDLEKHKDQLTKFSSTAYKLNEEISKGKTELKKFSLTNERLKVAEKELEGLEKKFGLYNWMFDNLPVMKLRFIDQSKTMVESLINENLGSMGLPFSIRIDTQKELSKGAKIKDEFQFRIINLNSQTESHKDDISGGEEVCILLATQFAIKQIAKVGLGFEIYDEVYAPVDKKNKAVIIEMLKERRENNQIFSISHDDEISNSFDKCVRVIIKNGVSELKGVGK